MATWAPTRHYLFHAGVRAAIFTTMLVADRLRLRQHSDRPARPLLALPPLMWRQVFEFFLRRHWAPPQPQLAD